MATKKISELTVGATLTGDELVPLVQSGSTVRMTAQDIANLNPLATAGWKGARVAVTADPIVSTGAYEKIDMTTTVGDLGGFVDGSYDLVVPAGVTRVRLRAYIQYGGGGSGGDLATLQIFGNGAGIGLVGGSATIIDQSEVANSTANLTTGVIAVTAGTKFDLRVKADSTVGTYGAWLEIEVVEGSILGGISGSYTERGWKCGGSQANTGSYGTRGGVIAPVFKPITVSEVFFQFSTESTATYTASVVQLSGSTISAILAQKTLSGLTVESDVLRQFVLDTPVTLTAGNSYAVLLTRGVLSGSGSFSARGTSTTNPAIAELGFADITQYARNTNNTVSVSDTLTIASNPYWFGITAQVPIQ